MRTLIVSLISLVALGFAQRAEALRQVRVWEVNVSSQADAAVQAQSGLRQVLVRATGARDAANDPALAGILANAQQYVIATRPASTGSATTLVFDAAALERDIGAESLRRRECRVHWNIARGRKAQGLRARHANGLTPTIPGGI